MRAVNLIPADAKRASRGSSGTKALPTYLLLGALAIAVGLVTLYVLASNDVSQRQAKVTTLQSEVAQVQARSSSLNQYAQFSQMTQSRVSSVRQLASGRFDWHATLAQISQVVPKNTSLATLNGTAVDVGSNDRGHGHPDEHRRAHWYDDRPYRLHQEPARRRQADVTPAADRRRRRRHAQQLHQAGIGRVARHARRLGGRQLRPGLRQWHPVLRSEDHVREPAGHSGCGRRDDLDLDLDLHLHRGPDLDLDRRGT